MTVLKETQLNIYSLADRRGLERAIYSQPDRPSSLLADVQADVLTQDSFLRFLRVLRGYRLRLLRFRGDALRPGVVGQRAVELRVAPGSVFVEGTFRAAPLPDGGGGGAVAFARRRSGAAFLPLRSVFRGARRGGGRRDALSKVSALLGL